MRIPTVKIRRPDGKLIKINETDLKFYIGRPGFECDTRPKKESGGEPRVEQEQEQGQEQEQEQETAPVGDTDKPIDESAPTTMKRKMIIQPELLRAPDPATLGQENLDDLLVD